MAALSAAAWLRSILVEDLAVLRPAEHQFQSQADQAQRLAERERQGLERLERRLERRLADEHELQRLVVLRTAEHERQRQARGTQTCIIRANMLPCSL